MDTKTYWQFESGVISYGGQSQRYMKSWKQTFESGVISYGGQSTSQHTKMP